MSLQELIYTSLAGPSGTAEEVKAILVASERNNIAAEVTGLLLYDGVRYIQILEGQPDRVESLFDTIQEDSRHGQIELLHKGPISYRAFENWRMAYESLPTGLLDDLAENMAVYSMELDEPDQDLSESFGARLNGMFLAAIAAE